MEAHRRLKALAMRKTRTGSVSNVRGDRRREGRGRGSAVGVWESVVSMCRFVIRDIGDGGPILVFLEPNAKSAKVAKRSEALAPPV